MATDAPRRWTLLSSHGQVLFYVATFPDATVAQIAAAVERSERRVSVILRELSEAGMLEVCRLGRRNHYTVNRQAHFRHSSLAHVRIVDLLEKFGTAERREPALVRCQTSGDR